MSRVVPAILRDAHFYCEISRLPLELGNFDKTSMDVISPKLQHGDQGFDQALRPKNFLEFVGQEKIKNNLGVFIEAAKKRKEPLEHLLLYGPSGLGKTTLSHIIAREMKTNVKVTSGPAIEKPGDLASILTSLAPGDVLFIDECHRLPRLVEETFYPAMEDYALDIIIGKGPSAKTLRLELPRFTLIGATTKIGLLSSPFRGRFGAIFRLNFYTPPDIEAIIKRSSTILNIEIEKGAKEMISRSARRTPRVANRILKRVRDFAQVKGSGIITKDIAKRCLEMLEIDQFGLEPTDRKLLKIIIENFKGGPAGLNAIAANLSEEKETIEDIYEPYLLQIGFITRTSKGRVVTEAGYRHLGIKYPKKEENRLL